MSMGKHHCQLDQLVRGPHLWFCGDTDMVTTHLGFSQPFRTFASCSCLCSVTFLYYINIDTHKYIYIYIKGPSLFLFIIFCWDPAKQMHNNNNKLPPLHKASWTRRITRRRKNPFARKTRKSSLIFFSFQQITTTPQCTKISLSPLFPFLFICLFLSTFSLCFLWL